MLKIRVELWPHGDEARKREIASMDLWNTGEGDAYHGDYEGVAIVGTSIYNLAEENKGVVRFHNRQQNVWKLVGKMLKSMGHVDEEKIQRRG